MAQNYEGGSISTYQYDANSNRVKLTSGAGNEQYLYDLSGHAIVVFSNSTGAWLRREVYAGGSHIGTYLGTYYMASLKNHLGSERVRLRAQTTADGGWYVAQDCTTNPYGDNLGCTSTSGWTSPVQFSRVNYAGYDYDPATGLYHMQYRYYNPRIGRFMSADLLSGDVSDPQSLNKLGYVDNNPVNWIDSLGLMCVMPEGSGAGQEAPKKEDECKKAGGTWIPPLNQVVEVTATAPPDIDLANILIPSSFVPQEALDFNKAFADVISSSVGGEVSNVLAIFMFGGINDPYRIASTRYCGPGGAGALTGSLDAACKAHDQCYDNAGLSATDNTSGGTLTLSQAADAQTCNQALYDAASSVPNAPGSTAVRYWLTHGDKLPIPTLAPGTAAHP